MTSTRDMVRARRDTARRNRRDRKSDTAKKESLNKIEAILDSGYNPAVDRFIYAYNIFNDGDIERARKNTLAAFEVLGTDEFIDHYTEAVGLDNRQVIAAAKKQENVAIAYILAGIKHYDSGNAKKALSMVSKAFNHDDMETFVEAWDEHNDQAMKDFLDEAEGSDETDRKDMSMDYDDMDDDDLDDMSGGFGPLNRKPGYLKDGRKTGFGPKKPKKTKSMDDLDLDDDDLDMSDMDYDDMDDDDLDMGLIRPIRRSRSRRSRSRRTRGNVPDGFDDVDDMDNIHDVDSDLDLDLDDDDDLDMGGGMGYRPRGPMMGRKARARRNRSTRSMRAKDFVPDVSSARSRSRIAADLTGGNKNRDRKDGLDDRATANLDDL